MDILQMPTRMPGLRKQIEICGQTLCMNDVLETKTVKGNTNYLIFFFERGEDIYCLHRDKVKKFPKQQFYDAFEYGDVWKITRENVDPERLHLSGIALQAMMDGMTFNDYMKVHYGEGEGSQV